MTLSPALWAGAFTFAGEGNGLNVITHPKDYVGSGGDLNVGVCIDPNSDFQDELEIPLRNNIAVWNDLQPVASNLDPNAVSGLDVESVLLHEMGHCIGLAHVNAASESGLSENDYTKATDGADNVFNVNPGPDGIPGTFDDIRGDDANLHWFNPNNDPFQLPIHTPVDTSQYRRDVSELPPGDSFAQNASREMAAFYGLPAAEAVMQQLTYYNETQRELISDGASTIMLAGSGLDETAGTSDDYQVVLTYEGVTTGSNCDITVTINNTSSFAYCQSGGSFVGNGHVRITSASIVLGNGYDWHFNTELRGSSGNQPPVAGNDSGAVAEDGSVNIAVLGNDSDPDSDTLAVTGVSNPPNGSASVNGDDTINYQPDANYNGADSFSYTLSDGNGGTDTGNVSVTVNPVNDAPVAADDTGISTAQDTAVEIFVLDNDSDVDNDALNVSAVSNGTKGTVANNNGSVTYSPNAGATGPDSFGYTVSDGTATDTATVSVNILAANVAPTAFFTGSCDGQTCGFNAAGSDDPDGSIVSYSWDFGDGATGSGVTPSHSYATAGTYTVTLTVTDDRAGTDVYSDDVTATPDPVTPDYAVADFNTVQGTLSGSYQATWDAGGSAQSIEETHSGGKPSLRSDGLEHIWQFDLAEGNTTFNVVASGDFPSGDLDTVFTFQWSTSSNGGWSEMVNVPGAVNTFDIPDGTSGVIYVRVFDNDSTQGNTALSTISVDHMFFDGATPPTEAPAKAVNPDPSDNASGVPVNATLSWSAGAGTDTHDVYFGTASGALTLVSGGQAGASYSPPADLTINTTYYWRVDETNIIGTTAGDEWSFTTSSNSGPTELLVGSIVLGTVNAGKGNKNGQAVVTVVDNLGNAISGANVAGTFSGSFNQNVSGATSGGSVTFTTSATAKGGASFTFCVDNISGSLPYKAGQVCQNF